MQCSGGRLEIGISAISTVICMLVKSLGTSSFTQTPVINYAPYLFHHIFIHLSSSSNSSLSIPTLVSFVLYVFYIHYLLFYVIKDVNSVLWLIVCVKANENVYL
jgi:hypothetical protein